MEDIIKELQINHKYKTTIGNKTILVEEREYNYLLSTIEYNAMGTPSYTYNTLTLTEVIRYFKDLKGVSNK
jgi:hypothetical protein